MSLFHLFIIPGFLFLSVLSLAYEFLDRKIYARLQNRVGPPWYQPLADVIKLFSKETVIPNGADERLFGAIPLVALAATYAAMLYVPVWQPQAVYSFQNDLIVIIYFLTLPTLAFFLAGWFSASLYAEIGAIRAMTQMFAYEVPFYMALLAPALLANCWSVSDMAAFYNENPLLLLINLPAFVIAIITAQGKLERAPFDIPDAETEVVGGTFTEYSGRFLGMFKMTLSAELVVVSALIAAVFFPVFVGNAFLGTLLFLVKVLFIVFLLSLMRAALARLRMDQMIDFCWKVLAPVSLVQIVINLIVKGVLRT